MAIRSKVTVPTDTCPDAEFVSFDFDGHSHEDIAILFPGWDRHETPLVRVHSECLTGEVFGSRLCDCKAQLNEAMQAMAKEGGILLYLRQEGRGIGLYNKLDAYEVQARQHLDTFEANIHLGFPADARSYDIAAKMLKDLNVKAIRLLTNNPDKKRELESHDIVVAEVRPTRVHAQPENLKYLETKRRHGHFLKAG